MDSWRRRGRKRLSIIKHGRGRLLEIARASAEQVDAADARNDSVLRGAKISRNACGSLLKLADIIEENGQDFCRTGVIPSEIV